MSLHEGEWIRKVGLETYCKYEVMVGEDDIDIKPDEQAIKEIY